MPAPPTVALYSLSALGSVCGPVRNWIVVAMVGAAAVVSANAVRFSDARTFKLAVREGRGGAGQPQEQTQRRSWRMTGAAYLASSEFT